MKSKPYIDKSLCAACSLCIENCPFDCLKLSEPEFHGDIKIYAYLANEDKCVGCGICAKNCPTRTIVMVDKESI